MLAYYGAELVMVVKSLVVEVEGSSLAAVVPSHHWKSISSCQLPKKGKYG
jgi:hypothetical protein